MRNEYWICDCPVCRIFVKPIFRKLFSQKTKGVEGGINMSQESRDKELDELKELVSALKDSIVELKATLMDAVSPFSKMKTGETEIAEEERLEPISAQGAPQISIPQRGVEETTKIEKPTILDRRKELETPVVTTQKTEVPLQLDQRKGKTITQLDLRKSLKLLKLLYKLTQSMPSENIDTYINFMKTMGLIDDKSAESLFVLKKMVDSGLQAGIDPEDQIIAIYSIAKMMGITDPELEEEIAFALAEKLKRKEAT